MRYLHTLARVNGLEKPLKGCALEKQEPWVSMENSREC
jgi:hypothetical protein